MAAGYSRTVYFILVQEVLFCSHIYALKNECVDAVKTGKMCHFSAVGRNFFPDSQNYSFLIAVVL